MTVRLYSILVITIFFLGCAVKPARTDLPVDHPANPNAVETSYSPPPNPFLEDITAIERGDVEAPSSAELEHESTEKTMDRMHHGDHAKP